MLGTVSEYDLNVEAVRLSELDIKVEELPPPYHRLIKELNQIVDVATKVHQRSKSGEPTRDELVLIQIKAYKIRHLCQQLIDAGEVREHEEIKPAFD